MKIMTIICKREVETLLNSSQSRRPRQGVGIIWGRLGRIWWCSRGSTQAGWQAKERGRSKEGIKWL